MVDLLSGGRMTPVFAAKYRRAEFETFDVAVRDRRRRAIETVEVCKQAWSGKPFDFRGHTVQITQAAAQQPRVPIIVAGASEAAARRAAHLADGFDPAEPSAWDFYRDECRKLGRDPGPWLTRGPSFLHITHDPDAAWAKIGPHLLDATNSYARWLAESEHGSNAWYPALKSVDDLRSRGAYQIVTPAECIRIAQQLGSHGHLN